MSDRVNAIEVDTLVKTYPTGHRALDGLTMTVKEGTILGFLGLNGAGKTTTIRIIAGLLSPDSGRVRVFGNEITGSSRDHLRFMGFVLDEPLYFEWMNPVEYLTFVGAMQEIPQPDLSGRVDELLDFFDLSGKLGDPIDTLSTGMKKKISLAAAILHRPRLVVLDEPLEGIDALAASAIKETLGMMARTGTTVLITSHVLDTIERLCSDIAILHKGRMVCEARTEEIRARAATGLAPEGRASLEELFLRTVSSRVRRHHLSFLEK